MSHRRPGQRRLSDYFGRLEERNARAVRGSVKVSPETTMNIYKIMVHFKCSKMEAVATALQWAVDQIEEGGP